ncbi:type VII secretion integral membrane protein EccD [Actinomyces sp. HPA0247]|jgi:secretion protein snm4|uniref:EsaB/YukD family protein n=1 Tax=Actinomycetes TaxID=1760 RepID=UPI00034EC41E|nr:MULTISPECIES: EsaB/YukD family protein [Actinomycetes]EPD73369.1 type VII secretion integral membrane protein EccD [Actinomyces sp. HPA0247]MBF1232322.1 type VII secretion system protein YukD [Isoptericola variabilis]MBF1252493.1 type VII secretion system protein YukD [Isoptericola variabilis]MDU5163583.1 EsaB/YukD family protein [Actinomyces sp.]
MASKAARGVALIPLTITYGVDRTDVTIPQSIPLVELLPGLVESVGAFSDQPTNDGFAVRTASGRLLDQSKSLSAQGVRAGAALTLEPLGEGAADMVYDDLTEAVGQVVERVSTPWTRDDARTFAALSAAALIFVAAVLLATTPQDAISSMQSGNVAFFNYVYGAIGVVAALLVTGTSAVVTRKYPGPAGIALAHTVPFLTAASALRLSQSQWDTGGWIAVGVGLLVGSLAALTLPKRYRISIAAPLVLGTMMAATGLMVKVGSLSQVGVSALLFALVIVLLQLAPWIALAHIPVRILDANTSEQIPAQGITDQVTTSFVFVVSLRAGGALAAVFLTVSMLSTAGLRSFSVPLALVVLGSVSLILQTRSIRARVEVLLSSLTGLTTILVGATLVTRADPASLPWVTLSAIAAALVLVVTNVVGPRARPHLTRIADTIAVLSLFVLIPLAVYLWG